MRKSIGFGGVASLLALTVLLTLGACEKGAQVVTGLGKPCTSAAECDGAQICLSDFPRGYCSADCASDGDCDADLCVNDVCLAACADDGDCRDGYSCIHTDPGRACAPPALGFHALSDSCEDDADCGDGLTCLVVTDGARQCTETCTSVLNCGTGALCIADLCRRTCDEDRDCHGDQECASTADGLVCAPVPPLSPLGGTCADNDDCVAGLICLTDAPNGYCTRECDNAEDCTDGVCHDGFCFSGCSATASAVDVLFVIDDSADMIPAQQDLIAAAPALISELEAAGTDYRLGVVSTDVSTGSFEIPNCDNLGGVLQFAPQAACEPPPDPWITSTNVTDPAASFACIAELGDSGCGFEQPLEAVQLALSNAVNPDFIRPAAHLMIVLLTTEDDCSAQDTDLFDATASQFGDFSSFRCFGYGIACDGVGPAYTNCRTKPAADGGMLYPISRYISQLEGLKGDLSQVTLVAIAGPRTPVQIGVNAQDMDVVLPSCAIASVEAQPGIRLGELLDATGGHFFSICNVNYDEAWQPFIDHVSGGGCRAGYQCTPATEGDICEPQ
jgi:hypothetical protein